MQGLQLRREPDPPRCGGDEIGRAACRGRGEISVVAVSLKKKKKNPLADSGTPPSHYISLSTRADTAPAPLLSFTLPPSRSPPTPTKSSLSVLSPAISTYPIH